MGRTKKAARKAPTRGAQVAKDRNKHKVVLPNSSKEQGKQLNSVITFKAEPPSGYTFIPAGNPELTAALKEFSRQGNHKIFAVTTTPHAARHELSREVHRIGFHFPTQVVAQVCNYYGIRLTSGGKLIDDSKDDQLFSKVYAKKGGRPKVDEPKDQVTINTEAKQTIKDLFPNIPDKDLFQIIKTAFQLGDGKVGTAEEIPLVRRAQLSVVAHIRHVYTNYDKLLRQMPYNDARHSVEQSTLARLVEWRGDDDKVDEATRHAAAEALREVIVISDEEETESEGEYEPIAQDHVRVEELATSAYAPAAGRYLSPNPSIGDPGQISHILPEVPRYRPTQDEIAQRDQSRYAVWDQAKRDYRSSILREPTTRLERLYERPASPSFLVPLDPPLHASEQVIRTQALPPPVTRIEYEPLPLRKPSPPTYIRDANGVLYERITSKPRDNLPELTHSRYAKSPPLLPPGKLVRTRPSSPQDFLFREPQRNGHHEIGDDTILPSIEGNDHLPRSPRPRHNPFDRMSEPRDMNGQHHERRIIREPLPIDYTSQGEDLYQRQRVENLDRTLPLQEYRTLREASPIRYAEPLYRSRAQPDHSRVDIRGAVEYSAQRLSPRLLAPKHNDVREPTFHPQYDGYAHSTSHATRQRGADVENHPPQYGGRPYETVIESRVHDNRVAIERNMGVVREEYAVPSSQGYHTRYVYPSGSVVRAPLEALPLQRTVDYDYRPTATTRSYALPSNH